MTKLPSITITPLQLSDMLITESFTGTKKTFRVTLTLINE